MSLHSSTPPTSLPHYPKLVPQTDEEAHQPVVACVLLNDRREVLLVADDAGADVAWRLPAARVPVGSSIQAAAEQTLQSEAGLTGRSVGMLDASVERFASGPATTVICVEMQLIDQAPQDGTAAMRRFFPLSAAPSLAIQTHNATLQHCAAAHLEEWIIRDSFGRLESDEGKALLSDELLRLISQRSRAVAERWVAEICDSAATPHFAELPRATLLERSTRVLEQFERWLHGHEADPEIAAHYQAIGRERRAQGFSVAELLDALQRLKQHLWTLARTEAPIDRPASLYRLLELAQRIAAFFDKAALQIIRGYDAAGSAAPDRTSEDGT